MTWIGWAQIFAFSMAVLLITKPAGIYLTRVYDGSLHYLGSLERTIYRVCGIDPGESQHWLDYLIAMMLFSAVSMLVTYIALRAQGHLPLDPQRFPGVVDRQAFETAASFTTNTNWQSYAGESTMSYLSQMMQLAFHNFASAAVGLCVAAALVRGIANRSAGHLGNFWTDLIRGTIYIFIPGAIVLALLFVQQGVIQNLKPYLTVGTLEGAKQVLAMG
ncbi:MAG TPA: potassium-transporting ATPase subunit KdpA, partial [Gemmatimonadaceae bacterium]|nr:potassium-transporting ATPase subunit KdpA [Gemmatimonadaceae bacterium]